MYFSLEEVAEATLDCVRGEDSLTICVSVDVLASLALGGLGPQHKIIAWQSHLKILSIIEATIPVRVKVAYDQLAILLGVLGSLVFGEEVSHVARIYEVIAIPIDPYEARVGLEVVQGREVLPFSFDS